MEQSEYQVHAKGLLSLPVELLEHIFSFVPGDAYGTAWMLPLRQVCRKITDALDHDFTERCFEKRSVFFLDRARLETLSSMTSVERIARCMRWLTFTLDPYNASDDDATFEDMLCDKRHYLEQHYKPYAQSKVDSQLIASILDNLSLAADHQRLKLRLDLGELEYLPRRQIGLLSSTFQDIATEIHRCGWSIEHLVINDQLPLVVKTECTSAEYTSADMSVVYGGGIRDLYYRADLSDLCSRHRPDSEAPSTELYRHTPIIKLLEQSSELQKLNFTTVFPTGPWPAFAVLTTSLLQANLFTRLAHLRLTDVVCNVEDLIDVLGRCQRTIHTLALLRVVNISGCKTWHDVFGALQGCPLLQNLFFNSLYQCSDGSRSRLIIELADHSSRSPRRSHINEQSRDGVERILRALVERRQPATYIRHSTWDVRYEN